MCRFSAAKRSAATVVAGVLFAVLTCGVVSSQPDAPHAVTVVVDDRPAGTVLLQPGNGGPLIAFGPLARALGWHFSAYGKTLELAGDGRRLKLTVGSTRVIEGGADVAPLGAAPVEIGGSAYLAVADVAPLFYVRTKLDGNRLVVSTATLDSSVVTVKEVKATPTPSPAPTGKAAAPPPPPARQAASVSMSLNAIGNQRYYQFGIISNTSGVRSNVMMTGASQLGAPAGSVTVGPTSRNVTVGDTNDPLSGIIMRNGALDGVDAYDRASGTDVTVGKRAAGQGEFAFSRRRQAVSQSIAILTQYGKFDQVLARETFQSKESWGELDREALLGTKGGGFGMYARTEGRTFIEGTATAAMSGLPLQNNDAPLQLDVARHTSDNVTVRAGFISGYQLKFTPFTSVNVRDQNMTFSGTLGGGASQVGAAYAGSRFNGQLYVGAGVGGRTSYLYAATPVDRLTLSLTSLVTTSSRDATLELQTQGHAVNFLAGVENVGSTTAATHFGPVVGASVPVFPGLAAQVAFNPTAAGNNVRFGLVASFKANNQPVIHSDRVVVTVVGGDDAGPMTLYVDGAPGKKFSGSTVSADITRGPHLISVETDDQAQGTPEVRLDVQHGSAVTVQLAPQRVIKGHLRIDAPASQIPSYFTVAGVSVQMQPSGQLAVVGPDGAFSFPLQAVEPGATLTVDPSTLPPDLGLEAPVAVPEAGTAELVLIPTKKVEKIYFPSGK